MRLITVKESCGELHFYTKQDVTPTKAAPREILLFVKNKFIAEIKYLREQGIIEKVTEQALNTALKLSECPIPTVDHLLTKISNAKVGVHSVYLGRRPLFGMSHYSQPSTLLL